ncbi:hypothetical protein ACFQ07_30750 [Actinomadura adrarensis]|uniref:Uncharacterized protein n=1 Tax=Actinomadura adrarensis TaxID=1819600 RepID=A0ABW3CT48_9ACTN
MSEHIDSIAAAVTAAAFEVTDPDSSDHGRKLVHCFIGTIGADWDLDSVLDLLRSPGAKAQWSSHALARDHGLQVVAPDGRVRYFQVQRPEPDHPVAEDRPALGAPVPANDRGFLTYNGGPIPTAYGHDITVQESSAASGPHVWLFIRETPNTDCPDPHLNLEQAVQLRAALDQFIESVPARWDGGAELVAEAKQKVLGES